MVARLRWAGAHNKYDSRVIFYLEKQQDSITRGQQVTAYN